MAYYIPGQTEPLWTHCGKYGTRQEDEDTDYYTRLNDSFQILDINDNIAESPSDMMLQKKEQKDAELDKKIEALRRKNEALMKRYQEVEEDKKRAEQGGMAMPSRKGKADDLTITINKSSTDKRVVTKKGSADGGPKVQQEWEESGSGSFNTGRGKRRQLLVTTPGNTKGKRLVSERSDKNSATSPGGSKPPCEDEQEVLEATPSTRRCPNIRRNQVGKKQERKSYSEEQHHGFPQYHTSPQPDALSQPDLNMPMSSEEQQEYLRWKKEREEIDRERVARHKNSQGQWRRAWDVDKPELMFSDKTTGASERDTQNRGAKNARRGHLRSSAAESRGPPVRQRDKRGKNVPVVGSKAKGKDRLTGRARRWDDKVEGEQLQACPETSLEEFLEELDALCDPEADSSAPGSEVSDGILKEEPGECVQPSSNNSPATLDTPTESLLSPVESTIADSTSPKGAEKKVRFSDDLIRGAHEKNPRTDASETKASSLKNTSPAKPASAEKRAEDQEGVKNEKQVKSTPLEETETKSPSREVNAWEQSVAEITEVTENWLKEETANEVKKARHYILASQNGSDASAGPEEQDLLHPMEHMKSNASRSTEELIDSSLSVLSVESGDPLPDHNTSTDKARENGKVV